MLTFSLVREFFLTCAYPDPKSATPPKCHLFKYFYITKSTSVFKKGFTSRGVVHFTDVFLFGSGFQKKFSGSRTNQETDSKESGKFYPEVNKHIAYLVCFRRNPDEQLQIGHRSEGLISGRLFCALFGRGRVNFGSILGHGSGGNSAQLGERHT